MCQGRAGVAELADALDLGSSVNTWGFKSLHPHQRVCNLGYKLFFSLNHLKNQLNRSLIMKTRDIMERSFRFISCFVIVCLFFILAPNHAFAELESNVKVSVILPICNNNNVYLSECLDSLVNQTMDEIEIICINYGSTDNNDKILEEYAKKDNRIIVVEQKNKESSVAKNIGLNLAKGEYITFVDANSYMDLNSYDWAYQIVKRNDDDVLEFGIRCFLDEDESGKTEKLYRPRRDRPYKVEGIKDIIEEYYEIYITNKLYKRSFLEENNIKFVEKNVYEDICFCCEIMPYIKNFHTRKNCFCNYKQGIKSIAEQTSSDIDVNKYIDTIKYICNEWERKNLVQEYGNDLLRQLLKKYYILFEPIIKEDNTYAGKFLEAFGATICSKEAFDGFDDLTKSKIIKMEKYRDNKLNKDLFKDENRNVKISVIVAVYNVEPWIRECLDTLINQTFEDIEIICINDGSTDNSGKILEEYAKEDNRIIVITQENRGVSATRNRGMEVSKGEYITFVDPDDYINLDTYEVVYSLAKKNNDDIIEFGMREFSDGIDMTNYILKPEQDKVLHIESKEQLRDCVFDDYVTHKLYNRDWLESTNIKFLENLDKEEDVCFNLMLIPYINIYEAKSEVFYNYRRRLESLTTSNKRKSAECPEFIGVIKPICEEWEKKEVLSGNEDFLLARIMRCFYWAYGAVMSNNYSYACDLINEFNNSQIDITNDEIINKCNSNTRQCIENIIEYRRKVG